MDNYTVPAKMEQGVNVQSNEESSYADKRQCRRHRRRFSLRFNDGTEAGEGRLAFTEDISRKGLFIKTAKVLRIGSLVQIALTLPQGEVLLDGKVMWGKKVQPTLLNKMSKAGMGILITGFRAGEGLYLAVCEELETR